MLDAKVVELRDDFSKRTAEAEALKVSLKQAEGTLTSAQTLLEKLGGERGRWDGMATTLDSDLGAIAANALLSAGFVTYLADEQEAFRATVLTEWGQALACNPVESRLSPYGGNPVRQRLQPRATEAATLCDRGCNPVRQRLF